jgi:hypothetical protein
MERTLDQMNRSVIIYHPDGQRKFSTYPIPGYEVVKAIVPEPGYVQIVYLKNGKSAGETYGNMPYLFELFEQ